MNMYREINEQTGHPVIRNNTIKQVFSMQLMTNENNFFLQNFLKEINHFHICSKNIPFNIFQFWCFQCFI